MKKEITVTIKDGEKSICIKAAEGEFLKEILRRSGLSFELPCGGMARCGRCRIYFIGAAPDPNSYDERFLSEKELRDGARLLCRCIVRSDCEVMTARTFVDMDMEVTKSPGEVQSKGNYTKYAVAVDIGTTTIASSLIGVDEKGADHSFGVIASIGAANSQRKYGADVISRIAAASDPAVRDDLHRLLVSDAESLIGRLREMAGGADINLAVVTGNTTMLHFFTGKDTSGLGTYPYTPVSTEYEEMDAGALFSGKLCERLVVMPGISAFVGADIVSGLYCIDIIDKKNKTLFADLGTNGELAWWDGENLRVTSTAAGPVFEAGNISCGMASVPGAVAHVTIDENDRAGTVTIGGTEPKGLCGSGVLEIVAELVRRGIADSTGLFRDEYFDRGFPVDAGGTICFTQKDMRQVQLAKAAVAAGIDALLDHDMPDRVCISGGLGSNMEIFKVKNVRMFPESFNDKITLAGNTALAGAEKFAAKCLCGNEEGAKRILDAIRKNAQVIELADHDEFDEGYIAAMNFTDR